MIDMRQFVSVSPKSTGPSGRAV